MENKIIRFSKAFVPCAIFSSAVILFGIAGFFTRGINFGIDFKPGLINEIRISPVCAELRYSGNAKVTLDLGKDAMQIIVSGTGAKNETKSYPYAEYPTVKAVADAVNADAVVNMELKSDGSEAAEALFVDSSVSPVLGNTPFYLHAKNEPLSVEDVRSALSSISGISIKKLGDGDFHSFQIRAGLSSEAESSQSIQNAITAALSEKFGGEKVALLKTDFIGSSFSKSLAKKSALFLGMTFLLIWAYAAIRFHWDFALGAIVALVHDALIMFTFIVWSRMEFTTTVLAAVLTIVGYSINDTVVILDRVRFNLRMKKVQTFNELLDISLNNTLSRSIITTVTTLFAVIALFVFTTGSIRDFSLALMVGMVSGLYSSLFISSGFISMFRIHWKPEFGMHHSEKTEHGVLTFESGVTV